MAEADLCSRDEFCPSVVDVVVADVVDAGKVVDVVDVGGLVVVVLALLLVVVTGVWVVVLVVV